MARDWHTGLSRYVPDREDAENPLRSRRIVTRTGFRRAITISIVGFLTTLYVLLEMRHYLQPENFWVGFAVALAPAPVYLALWLWLDRYDFEPWWALTAAFSWGSGIAVWIAIRGNEAADDWLLGLVDPQTAESLGAVITAPLIEEAAKGAGILVFLLFLRRQFDGIVDGIVYAGVIALGFSTMENVGYYAYGFGLAGEPALYATAYVRGVLSPFSHAFYSSMIGIGCGVARESQKGARWVAPVGGFAAAVALHAVWNGLTESSRETWMVIYLVFWVPLFLGFLAWIGTMVVREKRLIVRMLQGESCLEEDRPLRLSYGTVKMVANPLRRFLWVLGGFPYWDCVRARRDFARAVTRLAICRWHQWRARSAGKPVRPAPQVPGLVALIRRLSPTVRRPRRQKKNTY